MDLPGVLMAGMDVNSNTDPWCVSMTQGIGVVFS